MDAVAQMHECYRESGGLKVFDRLEDVLEAKEAGAFIVFFSYECLIWKQAGPNERQLHCMKESVKTLACQNQKNMDDVYVWLDCISIPQRNKAMQATSINSIYSFASLPNAMVIVCPDSVHVDTGQPANRHSIRERLWCRVEHLAYCCSNGIQSMYLHGGTDLEPLPDDWMKSVCCVFDSHSTCCRLKHTTTPTCDRKVVVQPLLALFYDVLLRHAQGLQDVTLSYAYHLIHENKDRMFPRLFVFETDKEARSEELFGDMIERVERLCDVALNLHPEHAIQDVLSFIEED